ncbi:MAG: hypothetical protein RH917_05755 [Lacipirellulaceae bacterium]
MKIVAVKIAFALVALSTVLSPAAQAEVTAKAVGLSIAMKDPESKYNGAYAMGMQPGLKLAVMVQSEKRKIINVVVNPKQPPKISAGGESLSAEEQHMFSPNVSDDGLRAILDVNAKKLPTKGTEKLLVTGELLVSTGGKTAESKVEAKLAKGAKFKLAGINVEVTDAGKPDWGDEPLSVTLQTSDAGGFDKIKELVFLDEAGNPIKSKTGGTMTMNFGASKKIAVDYRLAKKVEKATLKAETYTDLETKPLPLKLEVGLGL